MQNRWKIFAQRTLKIEKAFVPLIRKLIVNFRSSFINDLTENGKDAALSSLQSADLTTDLLPIVSSIYRKAGLLGARMTAAELKAQAKQKANGFGQNEKWIREVETYLRLHGLKMVQNISNTIKEDINKVLQRAVREGLTIDQIVSELKEVGVVREDSLTEARARTTARTEINRAANVGHSIAAQTSPYEVNKKWSAAKDHRTRHSHVQVNGNVVDEHGTFEVPVYRGKARIGTDKMQFPGDPSASKENTINCRCRVLYEPKTDSEGRLIMRRSNTATIIPMRGTQTQIPAHQIAAALKAHIRVGLDVTE